MESDGIKQRGRPIKTWWDGVREDMIVLVCPETERLYSIRTDGEGKSRGSWLTQVHLEMAVKQQCIF